MNKMGIFVREQAGKVRLVRQHYALTFLCSPSFMDYNS